MKVSGVATLANRHCQKCVHIDKRKMSFSKTAVTIMFLKLQFRLNTAYIYMSYFKETTRQLYYKEQLVKIV